MIEFYRGEDDEGRPFVIEVELDLETEDADWMLWAFVRLKQPLDGEVCSDEEWHMLGQIRNDLQERLELSHGAVYAGMKLQEGWAEYYFYAAWSKGAEKQVRDIFNRHGYTQIEFGANRDAKHAFYAETLYPDAYELQQIKDREVLAELEEEGDDLSKPRSVEHYLFFQTKTAMQRCAETLENKEIKTGIEEEGDYPHGLMVRMKHSLEPDTLGKITHPLIDAALKEHGIYLGWSTTLAA